MRSRTLNRLLAVLIMSTAWLAVAPAADADPATQPAVPQPLVAGPANYYIGGAVMRAGVYAMPRRTMTILQAVNAAGSKNDGVDCRVVLVRRIDDHFEETISFNSLAELRRHPGADIPLKADDRIMLEPQA